MELFSSTADSRLPKMQLEPVKLRVQVNEMNLSQLEIPTTGDSVQHIVIEQLMDSTDLYSHVVYVYVFGIYFTIAFTLLVPLHQ